jgi:hypothetical protein
MWLSIASAVAIELPLAFLLLNAARRLIWLSALVAVSERDGDAGEQAGAREYARAVRKAG